MASYLSYFTSGSNSNQPTPYGSQSAANNTSTSTWSSAFSSRISTLRKALTKDAEEDDPDHEDCSHVSNVLRAYYTEKGRTFPEWLPPDPKKPAPAPPPPQQNMYSQYGSAYGSQYGGQSEYGRQPTAQQGGLSDLWDSSPAQQSQAQSLRAPRPTPQSLRPHDSSNSQPGGLTPTYSQQSSSSARPLPSQRAGSYQNTAAATPAGLGSRDRLRARLQGGGSGRSSPAPQNQPSYTGSTGSYDSGGSGGSPYVSASEPWSSAGGNPYFDQPSSNPYAAGGGAPRPRPGGLPSGPRGPR